MDPEKQGLIKNREGVRLGEGKAGGLGVGNEGGDND